MTDEQSHPFPPQMEPVRTDVARADALVIFGATGDLAKLETLPALVGLTERGVLDMPVIGIAKSGWGLEQFRNYAIDSLRRNGIDPDSAPARKMLGLLEYIDGDLTSSASAAVPNHLRRVAAISWPACLWLPCLWLPCLWLQCLGPN